MSCVIRKPFLSVSDHIPPNQAVQLQKILQYLWNHKVFLAIFAQIRLYSCKRYYLRNLKELFSVNFLFLPRSKRSMLLMGRPQLGTHASQGTFSSFKDRIYFGSVRGFHCLTVIDELI